MGQTLDTIFSRQYTIMKYQMFHFFSKNYLVNNEKTGRKILKNSLECTISVTQLSFWFIE